MDKVRSGPMTGQTGPDFWDKNKKHGCGCAFCNGGWTKYIGFDGSCLSSREAEQQGYGQVSFGSHTTKWVMGCVKVHGYYDPDGSTPSYGGLRVDGITGQPGFSVAAAPAKPQAPKKTFTFAKIAPEGGCNCSRCGMNNPYAGPNKEDGTYVCYSCR